MSRRISNNVESASRIRKFNSSTARRGLSFVEFLGCLAALFGGVVLGAMYLGVDVKAMAIGVLEKSQLMPASAQSSEAAAEQDAANGEGTAVDGAETQTPSDDAAPTGEAAQSAPGDGDGSGDQPEDANDHPTQDAPEIDASDDQSTVDQHDKTKAYWRNLSVALANETAHRAAADSQSEGWELIDHLAHRLKGHEQVVEKLADLDDKGVDDKIAVFGYRALTWHEQGVELYGRAVELLTDSPTSELNGPHAQSWQSAATQHRMEERLLNERRKGLEIYMLHRDKQQP